MSMISQFDVLRARDQRPIDDRPRRTGADQVPPCGNTDWMRFGCPRWLRFLSTSAALFLAFASPVCADDWLQFRGPDGQGHAETKQAPLRWSESENVAWKVPVEGRGWSSPIVLGDQVWMTTAVETPGSPEDLRAALDRIERPGPSPYIASRVQLKAICIHRRTGKLIRDVTLFDVRQPVILCAVNSYASPTPVAESGRLYCDFGTMGTACLDTDSGGDPLVATVGDRASGWSGQFAHPAQKPVDVGPRRLRPAVRHGPGQTDGRYGLDDAAPAVGYDSGALPQGVQHSAGDRTPRQSADGYPRRPMDGGL